MKIGLLLFQLKICFTTSVTNERTNQNNKHARSQYLLAGIGIMMVTDCDNNREVYGGLIIIIIIIRIRIIII